MKTDAKGISTCQNGQEQFENFKTGRRYFVQYDYRDKNGKLFSCVAPTLKTARKKRDEWIKKQFHVTPDPDGPQIDPSCWKKWHEFNNCHSCYFSDKEMLNKDACCTYPGKPSLDADGKCQNHRLDLVKRVRQVRDALNKCKNPDTIEKVAGVLNI